MNEFCTTRISVLERIGSTPVPNKLSDWIYECLHGGKYAPLIEQYRNTGEKSLKSKLPLVCVGAELQGGHSKHHIIQRTGWVAFDIDGKDNSSITNWEDAKIYISKIKYTAFVSLSASAKGVWGLIKVADPDKLDLHFEQLKKDFADYGITLDPTKGKNANDLRYYSFDPKAYIAEDFVIYDRLPVTQVLFKRQPAPTSACKTKSLVEEKLHLIDLYNISIAPNYAIYRDIGFALASEFGEAGRDYFHRAVKHHHKYNQKEANTQYTKCLNPGPIRIGTFFHICKNNNI